MPISRDEWKEGRTRDTTKAQIENLLRNNQDKAYTLSEIGDLILGEPKDIWVALLHALAVQFGLKEDLEELIRGGKGRGKRSRNQSR